jgi:Tol biopolymer transport system component
LTFDPADDRSPVWSPDDGRLAFSSGRAAEGELWVRPTSGQGAAERLFTAETSILLTDWSSDGHLIFFDYLELDDDSLDVWTFNLQTSEARPLLSGKPEQQGARLSPDGKWLAFTSDESGKSEIYVQTFPEATGRWMVSSDGSTRGAYNAVWRSDGRELFYQRWRSLMAVPVTPGGDFPFGTPQPLFGINNKSGQGASYAVDESGDRILINERPAADPTKSGARLIQNWSGALAEQ